MLIGDVLVLFNTNRHNNIRRIPSGDKHREKQLIFLIHFSIVIYVDSDRQYNHVLFAGKPLELWCKLPSCENKQTQANKIYSSSSECIIGRKFKTIRIIYLSICIVFICHVRDKNNYYCA